MSRWGLLLLLGVGMVACGLAVTAVHYLRPAIPAEAIAFVYEEDGSAIIYAVNPEGRDGAVLWQGSTAVPLRGVLGKAGPIQAALAAEQRPHGLSWSADGRQLQYSLRMPGRFCDQIVTMTVAEQQPAEIVCAGRQDTDRLLDWAPDGQRLALALSEDEGTTVLILDAQATLLQSFNLEGPVWGIAWSPDGSRVAVTMAGDFSLRLLPLAGEPVQFQPEAAAFGRPAWSPDGARLAFLCRFQDWVTICTQDADGRHFRRFSFSRRFPYHKTDLQWSPNGAYLVFVVQQTGGTNDLYLIRPDGSGLRQLTFHPASDSAPAWSPDGTRLAFVSTRDGNREIYTIGVDGTRLTRVTETPGAEQEPVWRPTVP